jgi:hypothetical protein
VDVPRWNCVLWVILAAAVMPALGQGLAPAFGPANTGDIQSASSIPDFSGIWAHLTWPDFEPPRAAPGPVTNRSRRDGVSDAYQLVGDYTNPKPGAAEVVRICNQWKALRFDGHSR